MCSQFSEWRADVAANPVNGNASVNGVLQKLNLCDYLSLDALCRGEVVSAFVNVAVATANRDRPVAQPRVTAFNTWLYHDLTADRRDGYYRYDRVRARADALGGAHLDGDIVIPIHRPGHWVIAVIACRERHIFIIDSFEHAHDDGEVGRHADINANLRRWLRDEWAARRPGVPFNAAGWTTSFAGAEHPRQYDGISCGLFTCMQAFYWCRYRRLAVGADFRSHAGSPDLDDIRRFVCYSIMSGDPGAVAFGADIGVGGWIDDGVGQQADAAALQARALVRGVAYVEDDGGEVTVSSGDDSDCVVVGARGPAR